MHMHNLLLAMPFVIACNHAHPQTKPAIGYAKLIQIHAANYIFNEDLGYHEEVEKIVDSVQEGRLFSVKLDVKKNTIHDTFIRKSLRMEVILGRRVTALVRKKFVGIDQVNQSNIFQELHEISEAGDRIIIDLLGNREVIIIPITRHPSLHLSTIIEEAEKRNVYYGGAEIQMEDGVNGGWWKPGRKLKLKGFIRLNNCKFNYIIGAGGIVTTVTLDSIEFTELKITNSTDLNLQIKNCEFARFEMTGVNGGSLEITDNKMTQSFSLDGRYSKVKVERNKFSPAKKVTRINFGGNFGTMLLDNNKFELSKLDLNRLAVDNQLRISDNLFNKTTISMEDFRFPSSSSELLWSQFAGYKLDATLEEELLPNARLDSGTVEDVGLGNNSVDASFRRKVRAYQKLFNYYREIGDIESANACYIEQKEVVGERLHRIYSENGGFNNFISWRKSQLMRIFSKYGTDTPRAIIITTCAALFAFVGVWRINNLRRKKQKPAAAEKRLAALVFSDIVGYTSMMGSDEKKAMKALSINRSFHLLFSRRFNGELLKEMGDGMLCSFNTASDAVRFCIDIQREIALKKEFRLRMGVHLGEVAFSKGDVFGDGVNIASRLQNEAKEGGIYISETVYQNIRNQTEIVTEFVGERELKNVISKVKMFEVKY